MSYIVPRSVRLDATPGRLSIYMLERLPGYVQHRSLRSDRGLAARGEQAPMRIRFPSRVRFRGICPFLERESVCAESMRYMLRLAVESDSLAEGPRSVIINANSSGSDVRDTTSTKGVGLL